MRQPDTQAIPPGCSSSGQVGAWTDFGEALVVCDGSGVIAYADNKALDLLGRGRRTILGERFCTLVQMKMPDGSLGDPCPAGIPSSSGDGGFIMDCVLDMGNACVELMCEMVQVFPDTLLVRLQTKVQGGADGGLAYRATHDVVTGLPNRAFLQDRLQQMHRFAINQGSGYSLLMLDLDHFKQVNDRYGHATGDRVLCHLGRRIAATVRGVDIVGRWGGEEFLCLLPRVTHVSAEVIAERVRAAIEHDPVQHNGRRLRVTVSIGVASYPKDGSTPETVLDKADAALYEAKRSGRNRVQSASLNASNAFALAETVTRALSEERLIPAYQSVVRLADGEVCGAEALARIRLDTGNYMEAARFIPAAEQSALVHKIDHRIIRDSVIACVNRARRDGSFNAMFVNFSVDFLRHPDLVADVLNTVREQSALCGKRFGRVKPLVIEITERKFMEDTAEATEILKPFLDMGIRLAIDDFCAGYSSLKYLAELPVSFVKLEGELVRRVAREPRVRAIVRRIQELAKDLNVITVAEGIEDEETLNALLRIGIDWGQGYYFSRPSFEL